jgi:hypothetical protein
VLELKNAIAGEYYLSTNKFVLHFVEKRKIGVVETRGISPVIMHDHMVSVLDRECDR